MKVDDFVKRPRGPTLFDCHQHPATIPSVYGDFVVELHSEIDVPPTPAMVAKANALVAQFKADEAHICDLIFREYQAVCANPDWREWLDDAGVERGRPITEIGGYLEAKALVVADDLLASIYMSPQWDIEHGLYFDWTTEGWVRTD